PQVGIRRSGERDLSDARARSHRHVSRLYERVAGRKGHGKAIGAVARHLAEATYWMLSKEESYREPTASRRFVHGGSARRLHERPEARPLIATSLKIPIMPRDGADMAPTKRADAGRTSGDGCSEAEAAGEPAAAEGTRRLTAQRFQISSHHTPHVPADERWAFANVKHARIGYVSRP